MVEQIHRRRAVPPFTGVRSLQRGGGVDQEERQRPQREVPYDPPDLLRSKLAHLRKNY